MGADAFHVCYGVRREVDSSSDEMELLEQRRDPRQMAATRCGLDSWWGPTIDEARHFLLIGRSLGRFGWEGESDAILLAADTGPLMADVERRLREAGIKDDPAWHYQLEPDR